MLRRLRLALLFLLWRAYPLLYMRLPSLLRPHIILNQRPAVSLLLLWRAQALRYISSRAFLRAQTGLALAPAPRCAVVTAVASVPPTVHEPAVAAVVNEDIFA